MVVVVVVEVVPLDVVLLAWTGLLLQVGSQVTHILNIGGSVG